MNTANKLTLLRVVMIPAFLLVLYLDVPNANYWALAIFVIASLTDTLDGYIARHSTRPPTSASSWTPWRTSSCCYAPYSAFIGRAGFLSSSPLWPRSKSWRCCWAALWSWENGNS